MFCQNCGKETDSKETKCGNCGVEANNFSNVAGKGTKETDTRNSAFPSLMMAIVFTIINILLFVLGGNVYFLFSIFVPYMVPIIAYEFIPELYAVSIAISGIMLAGYIGMAFLAKKHIAGYIVSLVLYIIDTILLLLLTLSGEMVLDSIFDYVFHAWIIYILITAIKNFNKKEPTEEIPVNSTEAEQEQIADEK